MHMHNTTYVCIIYRYDLFPFCSFLVFSWLKPSNVTLHHVINYSLCYVGSRRKVRTPSQVA